jgi:hypothetical protein
VNHIIITPLVQTIYIVEACIWPMQDTRLYMPLSGRGCKQTELASQVTHLHTLLGTKERSSLTPFARGWISMTAIGQWRGVVLSSLNRCKRYILWRPASGPCRTQGFTCLYRARVESKLNWQAKLLAYVPYLEQRSDPV